MKIERRFTEANKDAYANIEFHKTTSEIRNPDGSVVFSLENVEVPTGWSQVAADVIAQKYFRKAGISNDLVKVEEKDVPEFLWRFRFISLDTIVKKGSGARAFTVSSWQFWAHLPAGYETQKCSRSITATKARAPMTIRVKSET